MSELSVAQKLGLICGLRKRAADAREDDRLDPETGAPRYDKGKRKEYLAFRKSIVDSFRSDPAFKVLKG